MMLRTVPFSHSFIKVTAKLMVETINSSNKDEPSVRLFSNLPMPKKNKIAMHMQGMFDNMISQKKTEFSYNLGFFIN